MKNILVIPFIPFLLSGLITGFIMSSVIAGFEKGNQAFQDFINWTNK